eukprot:3602773-Rhodomonas_salina.2
MIWYPGTENTNSTAVIIIIITIQLFAFLFDEGAPIAFLGDLTATNNHSIGRSMMVGIRMRALSCAAFVAITSCMANPFTGNSCFQETVSVPMGTCGSMKSKVLATFIVIQRISVASLIECMVYLRAQVGICAANSTASKAKLANVENLLARRGASVGLSTEDCTATYADICGSADKVSTSDCQSMCKMEMQLMAGGLGGCTRNADCPSSGTGGTVCCSFLRGMVDDICDFTATE